MRAEGRWNQRLLRWLLPLLAAAAPALVGYDIYFQWRTPVLDATLDPNTGLVYEVPQESFADWAGLWPGDVILSVDGVPFADWDHASVGNYMAEIERHGKRLALELPFVPLAKVNLVALVSAVAVVLIYWGTGLLLLLRRFGQSAVRVFFGLAQIVAIALLPPLAHPAPWPTPRWMISLSIACFHLIAPLLLHHTVTFPVSLGTARQRRRGLGIIYGLALVAAVGGLSRTGLRWQLSAFYTVLEVAAAIAVMIYIYVDRSTPRDRRRLRLVVSGIVLAAVPPILFYFLPSILRRSPLMPEWMAGLFLALAPLSYLYATVRHSLFDIDRLLNRALVYAFLSLGIFALFLGPLLLLYRHLPDDLLLQTMVVAALTLVVGLGFEEARTQVQRLVDRVFYGGWYDYPGVVETVSDALARSLEREQLTHVLTRQVPDLMQLRGAEFWIGGSDHVPDASPSPTSRFQLPLRFRGQVRGLWTVGPRRDGDDLTADDRRILQTLARQAEIALSNVLLVERLRRQLSEIREIQHQLLRSREEERSRLARDLHDGPIQSLIGMNMELGFMLISSGEERSPLVTELATMRGEVRRLLADLRQVCVELRPPMLDTLGLGAALRALVEEWRAQSDIDVALDLPPNADLRSLSDEVAVNLYRVVQEALANVARHAEASRVTISLARQSPGLSLTIHDDGRGFVVPPDLHSLTGRGHFGLAGMRERVDLIGGRLTVESAPGHGTTVRVVKEGLAE